MLLSWIPETVVAQSELLWRDALINKEGRTIVSSYRQNDENKIISDCNEYYGI